ncbi:MAG: hypothetical protein NTY19_11150 [Planctomycetota bacterium]|nr:hypothetical protein [Planctomycetota bacterium]
MDKKAVAEISLQKTFNKKWWDNNRSSKVKGTGTGALLDSWKKACPQTVEKLSQTQIETARKASAAVNKSLLAAQKMCGKSEQDDLTGIKKMLGLLDTYGELLDEREKAIKALATNLDNICTVYTNAKPELARIAQETGTVHDRVVSAEKESGKNLSETDKKKLLETLKAIEIDLGKLEKAAEKVGLAAKNAEEPFKKTFKAAREDKGLRPAFARYDTLTKGFDEISDRLHDQIKGINLDLVELIKDVSGSQTIDTTLKVLDNQENYLDSPTYMVYVDIVDKARVWLPRIVNARKNPEQVSQKDWSDYAGLQGEIESAARQMSSVDAQLGRVLKMSMKATARFKDDQRVDAYMKRITLGVKKRGEERSQMMKVLPTFQKQLQELLAAEV